MVNDTTPVVVLSVNENISGPNPIFVINLSFVSLVILLSGSLVTTCPRGDLTAKDFAACGFSSTLSRSNCGYKSTTF